MNNFTKKGIVQKIIVVLIVLLVFNFCYPFVPVSKAASLDDVVGGILLAPITALITAIGDMTMWLANTAILRCRSNNEDS